MLRVFFVYILIDLAIINVKEAAADSRKLRGELKFDFRILIL